MKELLKAKSEFRKKGIVLVADKSKTGAGGQWKFAGEDKFIKTIQAPLTEVGLEYIATLEALPELNINMVVGTLYHVETGQSIKSSKIIRDPEPKTDSNGNPRYLDAEIEQGKQFGYWARILGIRLLGLSDIDPEDHDNMPTPEPKTISKDHADEIESLIKTAVNLDIKAMMNYVGVEEIEYITEDKYPKLISMLKKKQPKDG